MASIEITKTLKREREETQLHEFDENKKHKSYDQILSILDDDENEPSHDLSSITATFQVENSSSGSESTSFELAAPLQTDPEEKPSTVPADLQDSSPPSMSSVLSGEEDKERVMRHLLEASDDELGIPTAGVAGEAVGQFGGDEDGFGLWEFEGEAANYYTLLQSELFR